MRVCVCVTLCSQNTILTSNRPRLLCRDYTKRNTETNPRAARGHKTCICANEHPHLSIFRIGKQTNHKTGLEIGMLKFLYAENLGVQNMPKLYR